MNITWAPNIVFISPAILLFRYINKIHVKYVGANLVGKRAFIHGASFNNQITEVNEPPLPGEQMKIEYSLELQETKY